jgi:hypothetical protein
MSSTLLGGLSRPQISRKGSSLTPDRGIGNGSGHGAGHQSGSGYGTPSRSHGGMTSPSAQGSPSMRRAESMGQESNTTGGSWGRSLSDMDILRADVYQNEGDENTTVLVETVSTALRRLREISRRMARGKIRYIEEQHRYSRHGAEVCSYSSHTSGRS